MQKIEVEIKGMTQYLMHRFGSEDALNKTKKKQSEQTPEEQAKACLYKQPDGKIYIPSTQIHGTLIEAGKKFQIPGQGKATYSKMMGGLVIITPMALVIDPQRYEIDSRAVVVPATRGRVMRNRPCFSDWKLRFTIENLEPRQTPSSAIQEILEYAGKYVGIGDFRPAKKGPFGRFSISKFEVVGSS